MAAMTITTTTMAASLGLGARVVGDQDPPGMGGFLVTDKIIATTSSSSTSTSTNPRVWPSTFVLAPKPGEAARLHKQHQVVALGGQNAIAAECRGPVVPADQTAVVVDVPVLGHVHPQHVLTAVALDAERSVGKDP